MSAAPVLVIGGGVNALTCAALLAKAGVKTLVLEQQTALGGAAQTFEIAPGFRVPLLAHAAGPLRQDVVEELGLARHGLEFLRSPALISNVVSDGPALTIFDEPARTAAALRQWSTRDAEAWPAFVQSLRAISRVIGTLYTVTPPPVDGTGARDVWSLLKTLRAFRALPAADAYRLLRWGPMAVADLVAESFETERLRATLAADGIFGTRFGPWSAGSGMTLLLSAANAAVGVANGWIARGGPGAMTHAIAQALRAAGGEVRTGARVARILVRDERAEGVALEDGTELRGRAVISGADPKQTFLRLCDPIDLSPEFLWRLRNYRAFGTLAKVNFALSGLPMFSGVDAAALGGRLRIAPDIDYLERAFDHSKYGRWSPAPYLEVMLPSVLDPALAPQGAHVMSVYAQFAPYQLRDGTWDTAREPFGDAVQRTIEQHAPGFAARVVARQVITPLDLEQTFGLSGGHPFHGELALDQLLSMRPLLGWGHYLTPIRDLFLCGSGTHPGTGLTGGSGANAAREVLRHLR